MTKIEWTHYRGPGDVAVKGFTLNPIKGCSHAAYQPVEGGHKRPHPGCTNCYAEGFCARNMHGEGATVGKWDGTIEFYPERLAWPFTKPGMRPRKDGIPIIGFLCSESDTGHEKLDREVDAFRYEGRMRIPLGKVSGIEAWKAINGMMLLANHVIWKDFTKRPDIQRERLERWSPAECWRTIFNARARSILMGSPWLSGLQISADGHASWQGREITCPESWEAAHHIHRYVSVSDQATADSLIPELLRMPAAVRGVSYEPAVGAVDFARVVGTVPSFHDDDWPLRLWACRECNGTGYFQVEPFAVGCEACQGRRVGIDHLIVGGESGPRARPFDLEWARSAIRQGKEAGMPVFVKQVGRKPVCSCSACKQWDCWAHAESIDDSKGGDPIEWPADLRVREQVGLPEVSHG